MNNFQTALRDLATAFESAKRTSNDQRFYRVKDSCAAWITQDVIREIHNSVDDRLPDDWIYEHIYRVADCLDDLSPEDADDASDDKAHEVADSLVDTYNSARYTWLASHARNADLCDEAVSEGLISEDASIADRIGAGQYVALFRIVGAVIHACDERATELDDAELVGPDENAIDVLIENGEIDPS